ncbi:unnamed protein product [Brassica rapa]|uniref:Uncharacterized protein n=1 Tax=Brassica campestris TaxID=3711 RepID=A0A3P6AWA6_BRACM|nr:unnamed protein product [Brassica rapa]VDC89970.1 unnamed protein product [Brassica rapa]
MISCCRAQPRRFPSLVQLMTRQYIRSRLFRSKKKDIYNQPFFCDPRNKSSDINVNLT